LVGLKDYWSEFERAEMLGAEREVSSAAKKAVQLVVLSVVARAALSVDVKVSVLADLWVALRAFC